MASKYLLQIVHRDNGKIVEWEPGRDIETEFITDCIARVLVRGVGLFKTSAHVAQDIEAGIEEAILELKKKVAKRH